MSKVFSFRLPIDWPEQLDYISRKYHFTSRAELLELALTDCAYSTITGKLKVKGKISGLSVIVGCRMPEFTHRAISELCCRQIKNTASTWAALVVARWVKELEREDNKQQKQNMYWLWLRDYAKNYRANVSRLQYEIARIMGVQQQ